MTMGIIFNNGLDGLTLTPCLRVDYSYPKVLKLSPHITRETLKLV